MGTDRTRAPALPGLRWTPRAAWARADPARRAAVVDAVIALVVTRVLIWATSLGAIGVWGLSGRAGDFDRSGLTKPFGALGDLLVAPAARWDSVWLLQIAQSGYGDDPARPAFFPLYPALVNAAGAVAGSAIVGGLLVSLACFGVALYLLRRLTALELGDDAARATVWLCALFPMSFFFSAVYSEGLFLMLSVGCVYAARTDRWAWAGTLGALAAGTRSAGVLLMIPLVLLWWRQRAETAQGGSRPAGRRAPWIAMIPLGVAAFCGFFLLRGGSGAEPFDAQAVWFRSFAWPLAGVQEGAVAAWDGAHQLLSGSRSPVYFEAAGGDPFNVAWHNMMLFAFLVAMVPAVVGVLRRLPIAYGAYTLAAIALPLSYPVGPQPLMSFPRFQAVLFPLAMWAGWWVTRPGVRPWLRPVVLAVSGALLVGFAAQFATWHWVA